MGAFEGYEHHVDTLERELQGVEDVFRGLTDDEWRLPTALEPLDADKPHWTVFELAGALRHLDRPDPDADRGPAGRNGGG